MSLHSPNNAEIAALSSYSYKCSVWQCDEKPYRAELCKKHYKSRNLRINPVHKVYAIVADTIDVPLVKIGVSTDTKKRLNSLQSGSPVPLEMVGAVVGGFELEKRLHEHLRDYQSHGEWFFQEAEVQEIVSHIAAGDIDSINNVLISNADLTVEEKISLLA